MNATMKTKKKMSELKRKEYTFATVLLIYPIVMFLIFAVYGQYLSILQTFQKVDMYGNRTMLPFNEIFSNYEQFINMAFEPGSIVYTAIGNSLKSYILCVVITNPLYIFFAYFIFRKVPGTKLFSIIIMTPEIISGLIYSLIFKKIVEAPFVEFMQILGFEDFPNLLNANKYAYGVTLFYRIWVSFGSSSIVYSNAMASIAPEIFESAKVDGCDNMFQELWYMVIPLIWPTFSTLLILSFATIFSIDNGLTTFYMYGAPPEAYNLGYYFTVKIFNGTPIGYPVLSAGGLMLTIILTPIVFTLKKYIEKVDFTE